MKPPACLLPWIGLLSMHAAEWHVAPHGRDTQPGTRAAPLRTIQRAADLAQPGDTITVHAGTYRERVNPPRGGRSERRRIVYRAAPGERVEIKGSEVIQGWEKVQGDVWKVTLPNAFFGDFNPYTNHLHGDWFDPRGRVHHTGAVYLDGEWLTEATSLEEVLLPDGQKPAWLAGAGRGYLLNLAWLRPVRSDAPVPRIPATAFAVQQGMQAAPCSEGGECLGWIEAGDWARYEAVDFGSRTELLELRVASATSGGVIQVRLDGPDGEPLGTVAVGPTGDWQAWTTVRAPLKPVSGRRTICLVFQDRPADAARARALNPNLWYAQVDAAWTTIWAQFPGANPNEHQVEINVRQTVFYPDQPGRDFITVRGFILRHAATPWAPPTAEQIGLIGTHWSRGWIIESNVISHSVCAGIALGKHGDAFDNTSANTAEGYVKTLERAHAFRIPWTREYIGHHVVRHNHIAHCEQAGIVGSLGGAFSRIEGNVIHDIHVRRLFSGAEMAGIKLHAAVDTVLRGNRIFRTCRGLWLDWMAQGTRVSGNLFYDNGPWEDLFVEVNHGPFLVDNNLFLSPVSLLDMSEGGAYAHNLFAGKIISLPELSRQTPYHPAHSTALAGLANIRGGDNRFYNNLFVGPRAAVAAAPPAPDPGGAGGYGLWVYDFREFPIQAGGNVYFLGARPSARETHARVLPGLDPSLRLVEEGGRVYLHLAVGDALRQAPTRRVDTRLLGRARIPDLPYVNPDDSPIQIATDFLGRKRSKSQPTPGPFERLPAGAVRLRLR